MLWDLTLKWRYCNESQWKLQECNLRYITYTEITMSLQNDAYWTKTCPYLKLSTCKPLLKTKHVQWFNQLE